MCLKCHGSWNCTGGGVEWVGGSPELRQDLSAILGHPWFCLFFFFLNTFVGLFVSYYSDFMD